MVGKLRNIHQVVDNSGHDNTGLVLVKVGEGELLQMLEHIAAHIRLHPDTDNVSLILHKILHNGLDDVDEQQRSAPGQDEL